ncbi:hypothetical protein [Candidatus Bandiella euplotis]|uniref:Uncharacterized protein n=1 Tax=Candidatus Bandiella euplotis TaxID=1664265 RepID=A0ABZ0UK74_9RICK|nr:hypothetical protein [Candidatus Bandiella woodruffii]WPX96109.1 hypothetical protein Bandiella_00213 [Candidatus Bandiella woodruffii]
MTTLSSGMSVSDNTKETKTNEHVNNYNNEKSNDDKRKRSV